MFELIDVSCFSLNRLSLSVETKLLYFSKENPQIQYSFFFSFHVFFSYRSLECYCYDGLVVIIGWYNTFVEGFRIFNLLFSKRLKISVDYVVVYFSNLSYTVQCAW